MKRFSGQTDNFDSETTYEYVGECLKSLVVLVGFRADPWFNVSGKDLFFSAHVDEVRVHSAALNVHNSGLTMTEPSRGLCGVTAGSTVAVAFESAEPGSPPPAW